MRRLWLVEPNLSPMLSLLARVVTRIVDEPLFASSLPVNPSFEQLVGARSVGSKCWCSISFSEMERLFRTQLEMMSSSLWLMSGILAMLKRDGFQPSDPMLFNASLSQQARSSSAGASFMWSKRRESLLMHTSIPVPEAQRRSLTVAPGSTTGLFNEDILSDVVAQVQRSSLISSNLAVSRSLGRGKSRDSSSSPLVDPSASGPPRAGRPYGKRSASSSRSGGRKHFRGGRGVGSFFQTFGFPEVGAIPLPDPVRRLSVPPLAGLEGQGRRSVGGGGAAGGIPYPFPQPPSAVRGAHPYAILQPLVHQRGCAWRGHPGFNCQGCGGACSASLTRLLQPSVCGVENLGIVASGHRSLDPQSLRGRVTFPDGDHPACPAFRPSGRLDGLHRSQGGLPTGSHPSGISPIPPHCGTWPYL